jgi:copper homeostasis protein (lipoprotein)
MRILQFHLAMFLLIISVGCNAKKQTSDVSPSETMINGAPDSHTSENALDWEGTYHGSLPCADCEAIKTTVGLKNDLTYAIKEEYLGKTDAVFESSGTFKWSADGQKIHLSDSTRNAFFVGENRLIQLDNAGNKITGDLAIFYILHKMDQQGVPFAQTKWKLVELMGKEVKNSEAFISFEPESNRVFGNNSCNNFSGTYEIKKGSQITISQVAATMRACLDVNVEPEFMDILKKADNYSHNGNRLTLNKARMAPLAVFEATE